MSDITFALVLTVIGILAVANLTVAAAHWYKGRRFIVWHMNLWWGIGLSIGAACWWTIAHFN